MALEAYNYHDFYRSRKRSVRSFYIEEGSVAANRRTHGVEDKGKATQIQNDFNGLNSSPIIATTLYTVNLNYVRTLLRKFK